MNPPANQATAVYDALAYVLLEELAKERGKRNAVVVLTDGVDSTLQGAQNRPSYYGSVLPFDPLLELATELDTLIYPIYLDTKAEQIELWANSGMPHDKAASLAEQAYAVSYIRLKKLAEASAGRLFEAESLEQLEPVYELIIADLRTVYTLAYTPTNTARDGKWRRIAVKLPSNPEAIIRTRRGYTAR